ncbi:MAG: NfeD family protein [Hyphomicrobiaceae bacterium]|nr:NfeD family protein [Hyphomicrobiaceae bacterium]
MVIDFLWNLGAWNWFIIAVVLFLLETIIPGVHFLWFSLAAVVVGVLAVATGIAWHWQLTIFALVAIGVIFAVRHYAHPAISKSDEPDLNVRGAQYIGRFFIVSNEIVQGRGKIRVGDTIWNAEGEDAPVGARVKVVGVDGTALVVERAETTD